MKKLFAVLLALLLALSMVSALAEEGTEEPQQPQEGYVENDGTFQIAKTYNITNAGTTFPGETINFTVTGEPAVTVAGVVVDTTGKAMVTFDLPEYDNVGIYTYTVKESAGQTAGVTYDAKEYTLTVTVANGETDEEYICYPALKATTGGEKLDDENGFVNTYSAGSLSVSKKVEGNLGDKKKDFNVTVTFTAPEGKTVAGAITWTDGETAGSATFTDGEATARITLNHDETVTFTNIPYGVTYTVVEDDYTGEGYDAAKYSEFDGEINSAKDEVTITNNKGAEIDTGITTDSMPCIVLMGIVVLAGVAMIAKRRAANND